MKNFQKIADCSKKHFSKLDIKYKDESIFMKILAKFLFFNKNFMTHYTTTIGSSIYFPSKSFVEEHPISASITLLHELVHVYDSIKYSQIIFSLLYLSPQILFIFTLPLLIISWKFIFFIILFLLTLPAFFRMHFEKRAYLVSLYCANYFNKINMSNIDLVKSKNYYLSNFKNSGYYFMWIFDNLDKEFDSSLEKIKLGNHPYKDPIFDIIDDLLHKIEK